MRANVPRYELRAPADLNSALELISDGWRPFAGGTDLMVLLEAGKLTGHRFAGLWRIPDLSGIELNGASVAIGTLTTFSELCRSEVVRRNLPLLAEASAEVGGVANQNRATLGGNLSNASPAADSSPALLAYDAELELASVRGNRRVAYHRFHLGYKQMDMQPDEVIVRIHLPLNRAGWKHYWRKVATRSAQAITKVSLAAAARVEGGSIHDVRIAFGAVAPYPLRCHGAEGALRGAALPAFQPPLDELAPIDDLRSTAHYRRKVASNLMTEFLASIA